MKTVLLLLCSNLFMTTAWYGHLKYKAAPLLTVILISWLIALPEYALQVPANRIGHGIEGYSLPKLKILQEVISIGVFLVFSAIVFREWPRWNEWGAIVLILLAVLLANYSVFFPTEGKASLSRDISPQEQDKSS